jgi:ferritin
VSQRKEIEKTLTRQRLQIDKMRRQQCTLSDELQDSKKHNLMVEQCITQIKSAAKDNVEEITKYFIKQSCEESKKRQKIEMDLLSTLQRVSALYQESMVQLRKHVIQNVKYPYRLKRWRVCSKTRRHRGNTWRRR